jgi:transposase InsO family protein
MNRLGRLLDALKGRAAERRKRGSRRQRRRREAERQVRISALVYLRWALRRGMSHVDVSDRLGMDPSTLNLWRQRWRDDRLQRRDRGRPADAINGDLRWSFLTVFGLMGPHVGLPTLQCLFPDVARSVIVDLQRRCRGIYRRTADYVIHALRWTRAGSVWAMDFSDPPAPIEGLYKKLLIVRDLASGYVILAIPAMTASAPLVIRVLESIFKWFGKPLVIKCDNDGAFVEEDLRDFLAHAGVHVLYSPPRTPRYNGSVEAGIGSIKTRAFWHAVLADRPGEWTCDDIEAAVQQANETGRPHGRSSPTPQESWLERLPISDAQRQAFDDACSRFAEQEYTQRGWLPTASLQHRERSSIDRIAISRALIDFGFLLIRRRRITPPVSVFRRRKIS